MNFDNLSTTDSLLSLSQMSNNNNNNNNNYNNNNNNMSHILLPNQAFLPIHEYKEPKRKDNLEKKLLEKLKEIELSNERLRNEVSDLKRTNRDPPKSDDLALKNATDMSIYLTKKLQNMNETVIKLELKLKEQEKKIMEDKGALAAIADKLVDMETQQVIGCQDKLDKINNEMILHRDAIKDLKQKINEENNEKKQIQQQQFEINQQFKHQQQQIKQQQQQQQQQQHQPRIPLYHQRSNTPNRDKNFEEEIKNIKQQQQQIQEKCDQLQQQPKYSKQTEEKLKEEIKKIIKNKIDNLKEELNNQQATPPSQQKQQQATPSFQQHQRASPMEIKSIKESLNLLADKQVSLYKTIQEKLQTEILTRQQFECDTLRQMTIFDEKIQKILAGKTNKEPLRTISPNKDLLLKEMDGLKKLIKETENHLDDRINNIKVFPKPEFRQENNNNDNNKNNDNNNNDYDIRITMINERLNDFKSEVRENKNEVTDLDKKLKYNFDKTNKEISDIKEKLNKKINNNNNNNYDDQNNEKIEEKIKKIKNGVEKNENQLKKIEKEFELIKNKKVEGNTGDDGRMEEMEKEIKKLKEKTNNLTEKIENETKKRTQEVKEINKKLEEIQPIRNEVKTLATSLQGTKNVLAMKIQYEEQEWKSSAEHLQNQIDKIEKELDEVEKKQMRS